MVNRIPDELVEQVRQQIDIVDVISEYVSLKKQGRNYFGLCPFHGEKSPSFSVSTDKQIYHCFGCGKGGNVYSFMMDIEGISFVESVQRLAERTNVVLPQDVHTPSVPIHDGQDDLIEAHELLRKFYHHLLLHTNEGQEALNYLKERGFTEAIIEQFQIGYSLPSRDFIVKFLEKRGFTSVAMEKAGLLIRRDDGTYIDRFRHRVMFPLWNPSGKTIAFSGRALGGDEPKYLNSPETPLFHKGSLLYNYHQARQSMRKLKEAVLFEGFADVIAASTAGIANGVATMGTALTEEHVRLLKATVQSVIVCYDGDSAGFEAAYKAAKMLHDAQLQVKVAQIPEQLDPDDFIRRYGTERFINEVIQPSLTYTAFLLTYLRRNKNLQVEGEKIQYVNEAIQVVQTLQNAVERDYYLRQLAEQFDLSLDVLRNQIQPQAQTQTMRSGGQHEQMPAITRKIMPAYFNAERQLLAHMLRDQAFAYRIQRELSGQFNIDEHRTIATFLYGFYEEGHEPNVGQFLLRLPEAQLQHVTSEISMMNIQDEISEREIQDLMKHVVQYPLLLEMKQLEEQQREAERLSDPLRAAQIAMEIVQMRRQLKP